MTKPSITNITDLGNIIDEDNRIFNKVITAPIPFGNTSTTRNVNLKGKKRLITLTAVQTGFSYAGATAEAKIKAFIADVEEWINNGVQTTRTYTDSFANTYAVLCIDFNWTRTTIATGRIAYTMVLIQGGLIS